MKTLKYINVMMLLYLLCSARFENVVEKPPRSPTTLRQKYNLVEDLKQEPARALTRMLK